MRAKRFALFVLLIAVFIVVVLLIPKLIYRHPYVNTAGEIVFASDRGSPGRSHIFLAKPDGSAARQITSGSQSDTQPSFSRDGTQIAFVSDRGGSPQVYVMDADGNGARAVSSGTDEKLTPQFSSDGQSIGYIARGQLIVAGVIGGHTSIILPTTRSMSSSATVSAADASRAAVVSFAWSPSTAASEEDKIVAVQQPPDSDTQLVALVDSSDSSAAPKFLGGASQATVAWSPDGTKIAAAMLGVAGPDGNPMKLSGIAEFDSNGGVLSNSLTAGDPSATVGPQSPTYSPSGTKLVFIITALSNLNTPISSGLGITDAQPGARPQAVLRGTPHAPEISKDGRQFLFLGPAGPNTSNQALFVADPADKKIQPLTTADENVTAAHWSPARAH